MGKRNNMPSGEDVWRAVLSNARSELLGVKLSHTNKLVFSHKSTNRCLENYENFFSVKKKFLVEFYREIYFDMGMFSIQWLVDQEK